MLTAVWDLRDIPYDILVSSAHRSRQQNKNNNNKINGLNVCFKNLSSLLNDRVIFLNHQVIFLRTIITFNGIGLCSDDANERTFSNIIGYSRLVKPKFFSNWESPQTI